MMKISRRSTMMPNSTRRTTKHYLASKNPPFVVIVFPLSQHCDGVCVSFIFELLLLLCISISLSLSPSLCASPNSLLGYVLVYILVSC